MTDTKLVDFANPHSNISEEKKSKEAQRNRHEKLPCQQRLGYIHAPKKFEVPIMMEDGTLIWQDEHGPLPCNGEDVEKHAHRQALSLDESQRLRFAVGVFGLYVAEYWQEP